MSPAPLGQGTSLDDAWSSSSTHESEPCALLLLFKSQRGGINAVAQAGRFGTVFENMAQVPAATSANDFRAAHEEGVVGFRGYLFGFDGLRETRPAGAGIKFVL